MALTAACFVCLIIFHVKHHAEHTNEVTRVAAAFSTPKDSMVNKPVDPIASIALDSVMNPHDLICDGSTQMSRVVQYWKAESADLSWRVKNEPHKYVTFEPDAGGWNNIRLGYELFAMFAATSGR